MQFSDHENHYNDNTRLIVTHFRMQSPPSETRSELIQYHFVVLAIPRPEIIYLCLLTPPRRVIVARLLPMTIAIFAKVSEREALNCEMHSKCAFDLFRCWSVWVLFDRWLFCVMLWDLNEGNCQFEGKYASIVTV